MKLPEGFLLGSATSATQVEGGDTNNSWYRWSTEGKIKDGSNPLRANDDYRSFSGTVARLRETNQKVYRLSLEWSRIEPSEGKFSEEAIAHYREQISLLLQNGILPLVTIFHFSLPLWFEAKGGFESKESVDIFTRYVKRCAVGFGDLCNEFVTINEPNVYATMGYFYGDWPPGKKSFRLAMKVFGNLALAHIKAYKVIHEVREQMGFSDTMVGFAPHYRVFVSYGNGLMDTLAASAMRYLFQDAITKAMATGKLFPFRLRSLKGKYYDFVGVNYYTISQVKFKGFQALSADDAPKNDLGWEIYPQGLYDICLELSKKYDAPIWITENGICDKDDTRREKFIRDHLNSVILAASSGAKVERYYHWTLMDNFEWLEGESAPFGLYETDFEKQRYTLRKSGRYYAKVCKTGETD